MRCSDLRWKLNPFLDGKIADDEADEIRHHLDFCRRCVSYLVDSGKIERLDIGDGQIANPEFAKKVVNALPNRSRAAVLTRYFVSIVIATSIFAVAVFAFLKHSLSPGSLAPMSDESALLQSFESMVPWFEQAVASPVVQLIFLSLVATLITVALIALVDIPRQPLRRSKS
jgi:anti-sigma factor RsiW